MDVAQRTAQLSRAIRLQVGSVIVKNGNIVAFSYNGTPAGDDNSCENKVYMNPNPMPGNYVEDPADFPYEDAAGVYRLVTKDTVLHAEENAILKMAAATSSSIGATIYVTHSPCIRCARMIHAAGFTRLVYKEAYWDTTPIDFLKSKSIECDRLLFQPVL